MAAEKTPVHDFGMFAINNMEHDSNGIVVNLAISGTPMSDIRHKGVYQRDHSEVIQSKTSNSKNLKSS